RDVHGHAKSRRIDPSIEPQRNPHLSLTLRDLSLGGLSAISDVPVMRGERVAVFFPPQGSARGWDAGGAPRPRGPLPPDRHGLPRRPRVRPDADGGVGRADPSRTTTERFTAARCAPP